MFYCSIGTFLESKRKMLVEKKELLTFLLLKRALNTFLVKIVEFLSHLSELSWQNVVRTNKENADKTDIDL